MFAFLNFSFPVVQQLLFVSVFILFSISLSLISCTFNFFLVFEDATVVDKLVPGEFLCAGPEWPSDGNLFHIGRICKAFLLCECEYADLKLSSVGKTADNKDIHTAFH